MDKNTTKVLLIEKDANDARVFQKMFRQLNQNSRKFHLDIIDRLDEALAQVSNHHIDTLLIDDCMLNGRPAKMPAQLEKLTSGIPIIVLSSEPAECSNFKIGMYDYLSKNA